MLMQGLGQYSREKGEKESINTWTNDFSEASVVRMTPQNEVKKGSIVLIINRKQSFHLSAPVFWFYHFLSLTLSEIKRTINIL